MGNSWKLPTSINVGGVDYRIRTDYETVLDLLTALNDPELTDNDEKITAYMQSRVIMEIMIPDCDKIPVEQWEEALQKVSEFIDMGISDDSKKPKTMDWEQDYNLIVAPINSILGYDIRKPNIETHWWTFLSAYMEIGESLFSNVIHIRQKKAKGKKLEKHEQEFYKENKSLIDFRQKNQRSEEEKNALRDYFGYRKK